MNITDFQTWQAHLQKHYPRVSWDAELFAAWCDELKWATIADVKAAIVRYRAAGGRNPETTSIIKIINKMRDGKPASPTRQQQPSADPDYDQWMRVWTQKLQRQPEPVEMWMRTHRYVFFRRSKDAREKSIRDRVDRFRMLTVAECYNRLMDHLDPETAKMAADWIDEPEPEFEAAVDEACAAARRHGAAAEAVPV